MSSTAHGDAHAHAGHDHAAHSHDGHGHVAGADHVPHVLPLSVYIGVWVALIVFTAITVGVSYVDIGRTGNLLVAVGVATMKALMVAAIFMHLAFDKKFNSIIFASSLIFLAIFVGFTMFDTNARGMTDRGSADKPATVDTPFESTRGREAIRARYKDSSKLPPPPLPGRESELSPVVPPPSDSAPAVDEANHGAPAAGSKDGEHQQPGH